MGGAPPPPHDFAPQGPKNRRNSAQKGPDFGRFGGAEDQRRDRGVGGIQPTTPRRFKGWFRAAGPENPLNRRVRPEDGSGNQGLEAAMSRHGPDLPRPGGSLGDGLIGDLVAAIPTGRRRPALIAGQWVGSPLPRHAQAIASAGTEECNRPSGAPTHPKQMRDMSAVPRGMSRYAWGE